MPVPFAGTLKEVSHLVNERVLIADLQPGHPPVLHVGMIAVRDVNALPSPQPPFIAVIEILETVQVVEIPPAEACSPFTSRVKSAL
jgi:hypothetical protein